MREKMSLVTCLLYFKTEMSFGIIITFSFTNWLQYNLSKKFTNIPKGYTYNVTHFRRNWDTYFYLAAVTDQIY